MKKFSITLLFGIIIFLSLESEAGSEPNEIVYNPEPSHLAFLADITWASQYMLDGFKVSTTPVWQMAFKTDIFQSGFSIMLWGALQADRHQRKLDEEDIFLLYTHDFFKENLNHIKFHAYADYWIFPNTAPIKDEFGDVVSSAKRHGNKFQVGFSMPQRFPLAGSFIIPSYNIYRWIYYDQDRADLNGSGARHQLLFEFDRSIAIFIPGANYQYAGVAADLNYNDGVFGIHPGLSHSVVSLRTGVYTLKSIFEFTVNHQWTFEPTLDTGNELWSSISYIKKF